MDIFSLSIIRCYFVLLIISVVQQLPLEDDVLTEFGNRCGFCGTNDTEYIQTPLSLCCAECSCETDCESTENCCFGVEPEHSYLTERRSSRECLYPVKDLTSTYTATRTRVPQFYMVTRCNEKHRLECTDETSCSCEDAQVASWGSLHPVYSAAKDEIYKNMECAKCNDANDTELFVPSLVCKMSESENTDAFLRFLYGRNYYDQCWISFDYDGSITNILPHACFEGIETECDGSKLAIPWGVNLNASQIVDACNSRLFSPVIAVGIYKNVFCAMCDGVLIANTFGCSDFVAGPQTNERSPYDFSTLLDTTFTYQSESSKNNVPLACAGRHDNKLVDCREIYCPTGQILMGDVCDHIAKEWYVHAYRTQLKLTPNQLVDAFEYEQVMKNFSSIEYDMFQYELPVHWRVAKIFHEKTTSPTSASLNSTLQCSFPHGIVKQINVFLYYINPAFNQTNILDEIHDFIKKPWILKLGETDIVLESSGFLEFNHVKELDDHAIIDFYAGSEPPDVNVDAFVPEVNSIFIDNRKMYTTFTDILAPGVTVTSTFYCQQIRLKDDEFIMVSGMKVIYYKKMKRYLLEGEYVTVIDDNGKPVPQICLDGSGYHLIDDLPNASSRRFDHQFLPLYLLVPGILLFD
ncbi:hypothetical protein ACF0H5_019603 [Mactra antiquata]